jgi:hypothetical protein
MSTPDTMVTARIDELLRRSSLRVEQHQRVSRLCIELDALVLRGEDVCLRMEASCFLTLPASAARFSKRALLRNVSQISFSSDRCVFVQRNSAQVVKRGRTSVNAWQDTSCFIPALT